MFDINTIILEGPDLSGKTTLYNEIHRLTKYRWNIQDRSSLSMVCFARQYGRSEKSLRRALLKEITYLNNRMIVLLPDWDVIEERYKTRGDEIQTLSTLKDLYTIFQEEVTLLEGLPNVHVIRDVKDDLANNLVEDLRSIERKSELEVGNEISEFLTFHSSDEVKIDVSFTGKINVSHDDTILADPLEGEYYRNIKWDFENVIRKELRGLNPYNTPQQPLKSRRFYYSSDSCISSIHFMPREDVLKCFVTFRSTNAVKNSAIDLEFIKFLVHDLGSKYFLMCKVYELDVRMNSAHLVK